MREVNAAQVDHFSLLLGFDQHTPRDYLVPTAVGLSRSHLELSIESTSALQSLLGPAERLGSRTSFRCLYEKISEILGHLAFLPLG